MRVRAVPADRGRATGDGFADAMGGAVDAVGPGYQPARDHNVHAFFFFAGGGGFASAAAGAACAAVLLCFFHNYSNPGFKIGRLYVYRKSRFKSR